MLFPIMAQENIIATESSSGPKLVENSKGVAKKRKQSFLFLGEQNQ